MVLKTKVKPASKASMFLTEKMKSELKKKIDEVKKLLGDADSADAGARYEIGKLVLDVEKSSKTYGAHAVEQLEEALGLDKKTLYRYARVADTWSQKEFGGLRRTMNSKKTKLSWSHYELLAPLHRTRRKRLLKAVLIESLSVRALQQRIQQELFQPQEAKTESTSPVLERVRDQVNLLVEQAEESKASILSSLPAGDSLPSEARTDLEAALEQWRRLRQLAQEVAGRLERTLGVPVWAATPMAGRLVDLGVSSPAGGQDVQPSPAPPAPPQPATLAPSEGPVKKTP